MVTRAPTTLQITEVVGPGREVGRIKFKMGVTFVLMNTEEETDRNSSLGVVEKFS